MAMINIDAMDRISNLPESLMLQIVSLLPLKDSRRMSSLSKAWHSLPVSYFGIEFDSEQEIVPYRDQFGIDCKRKRSKQEFETFVDESLRILVHQLDDRKRIDYFKMAWKVEEANWPANAIYVGPWINLVSKHFVKHLELNALEGNYRLPHYRFPPDDKALENLGSSLVVLKLSRFHLGKALNQGETRFSFLQELSLHYVDFHHPFRGKFLWTCPLLTTLDLYRCDNRSDIGFGDDDQFLNQHVVDSCKIEAPNLQTLTYSGRQRLLELETICSSTNLKKLSIATTGGFTSQYIEKLTSKFPSLVELDLSGFSDAPEMKIALGQLKSLALSLKSLEKINLDTPSLVCYSYQGHIVKPPAITLSSLLKPKLATLELRDTHLLHTESLLNLRQYLTKFTSRSGLNLRYRFMNNANANIPSPTEVLRRSKTAPSPLEVQHLSVENIPSSTLQAVIDNFLSICHPITLSIKLRHPPLKFEFIKSLCEKVMCTVNSPQCCKGLHYVKCWRHYVKSVKIQSLKGKKEDGQLVEWVEGSSCNWNWALLTDLGKVKEVTFELQWFLDN